MNTREVQREEVLRRRCRRRSAGGAGSALPVLNQSADLAPEGRGVATGAGGEVRTAHWEPREGRAQQQVGRGAAPPGGRAPAPFCECLQAGALPPRTSSSLRVASGVQA